MECNHLLPLYKRGFNTDQLGMALLSTFFLCLFFVTSVSAAGRLTREEIQAIMAGPGMQPKTVNLSGYPDRELAIDAFAREEFDRVIRLGKAAADAGDAQLQYMLGVAYYLVTPQDLGSPALAKKYIDMAARQNNPYALWSLGSKVQCKSWGTCDDDLDEWHDKARAAWKQLAEQGNTQAMFFVALAGRNSWKSYVPFLSARTQMENFEKAARAGSYQAMREWFSRNRNKIKDGDKDLRAKAISLLTPFVKDGNTQAMMELARVYNYYTHPSEIEKSVKLWKMAEELGGGNLGSHFYGYYKDIRDYKNAYLYEFSKEMTRYSPAPIYEGFEIDYPDIFTPEVIKELRAQAIERYKQIVKWANEAGYKLKTEKDVNYFPAGWSFE
ncbi:hypothetical protein QCD60_10230 [Pokkaliibacter sp. MBI-7]|uniref:tetratricopeptide repeat protein n=1 Tax=Pokkaliibacter sp. MBI-7 TaxID=3040600 RepID=UPI00244C759D|nr:hypothetical protein [Pokkaliibacter sp. MBI-7]MDH2432943.1 hypothetical protein [Pokkaliibacter sp. MBI-7]